MRVCSRGPSPIGTDGKPFGTGIVTCFYYPTLPIVSLRDQAAQLGPFVEIEGVDDSVNSDALTIGAILTLVSRLKSEQLTIQAAVKNAATRIQDQMPDGVTLEW